MLGLAKLARAETTLTEGAIDHLQRLVEAWSLLADLSFGDLLLYAPCGPVPTAQHPQHPADADPERRPVITHGVGRYRLPLASHPEFGVPMSRPNPAGVSLGSTSTPHDFVVLAHVRATTAPTVHVTDPVRTRVSHPRSRWLHSAINRGISGQIEILDYQSVPPVGDDDVVHDEVTHPPGSRSRVVSFVPVRRATNANTNTIAVLAREGELPRIRHRSPLEDIYRGIYSQFAQMISDGTFPYEQVEQIGQYREPRVSDGVLLHDQEGRVAYASPNAVSALHRLGVIESVIGRRLRDLGLDDTVVLRSFWRRRATVAEFGPEPETTVVMRSFPLLAEGRVSGAVAVLRDISELRNRDRLLVSKDVTIREIHHRVKNNLQTVSSLLNLQVRRLPSADARAALESSVRRISSIAMVHEHLSRDTSSEVNFDNLVVELVKMVRHGLATSERPVDIRVDGSTGNIDGEVAMPLAVVLVELVQNALQHAGVTSADVRNLVDPEADLPSTGEGVRNHEPTQVVSVHLTRDAERVKMRVGDSGPGVPEGFSLDRDAGLGLTVVRAFVVQHLGGTISIRGSTEGTSSGAVVEVAVPRRLASASAT